MTNRFKEQWPEKVVEKSNSKTMNVMALVRECGERYIFLFDDTEGSHSAIFNQLGKFAADPELSFSWHEAAILAQKAKHLIRQKEEDQKHHDDFGEGLEL